MGCSNNNRPHQRPCEEEEERERKSMLMKALALGASTLGAMGMVKELTLPAGSGGVMTYIGRFSYVATSDSELKDGYGGEFDLTWTYNKRPLKSLQASFVSMWEGDFDHLCTDQKLCGDKPGTQWNSKDEMCQAIYKYKQKELPSIVFKPATNPSSGGFSPRKNSTFTWKEDQITQSRANFWYFYWVQCDLSSLGGAYVKQEGTTSVTLKSYNDGRG